MKTQIKSKCLLVLAITSHLVATEAAVITQPSGLQPGDKYRLAFVTIGTIDATSSDIEVYNNFANAQANINPDLQALGTSWRAIVSTVNVNAIINTGTDPILEGVPIYELAGRLVASDYADLWDGTLDPRASISPTQTGDGGIPYLNDNNQSRHTWTGTDPYGNTISPLGGASEPSFGDPTTGGPRWIYETTRGGPTDPHATLNHIYVISDELSYTPVPEPSTVFAGVFSLGVIGMSFLRRRNKK